MHKAGSLVILVDDKPAARLEFKLELQTELKDLRRGVLFDKVELQGDTQLAIDVTNIIAMLIAKGYIKYEHP